MTQPHPQSGSAPGTVPALAAGFSLGQLQGSREATSLLQQIWDNAADGMRLTDAQGTVRRVNAAFCRMVGKRKEELEGKPLTTIYSGDQQSRILHEYQRRYAGRLIPAHRDAHVTFWDGRSAHFELSNSYLDGFGSEPLLLTIFHDVTERVALEEQHHRLLRERAQLADYLSLLLESTAEGIYGVDLEGRCTFINRAAAKMLGYVPGDLLQQNLHDAIHAPSEPGTGDRACPLCKAVRSGQPCQTSTAFLRRRDGHSFAVDCSSYPMLHDGFLRGAVVTFVDQKEQERLHDQFRQQQKMEAVGRLAGGVAHDFNNLLTVILGQTELLRRKVSSNESLTAHLEDIRKAGERAVGLTRQLLLFSRKQVASSQVVNFNHVISETELLQRLVGEDIECTTKMSPDLDGVQADPSQIHQLLLNLVMNARDAMPDGGKLTIATENVKVDELNAQSQWGVRPGAYVRLTVADTGCGMPPEVQAHLFEPFFTTKEPGKGVGLGLPTVYGIVKRNGGFIELDSSAGRGTSFKVYFPSTGERAEPAKEHDEALPPAKNPRTILLVEDEEMVRRMIRTSLWWHGHNVLEAASGPEAIELAQSHKGPIDLLLTDVCMPEMNGQVLAEQLLDSRPELKVLFVSGYTDGHLPPLKAKDTRAAFLPKPFSPDVLARKVSEVLSN